MNESNDNQDHELVKKHEVSSIDSTQNEDSLNAHTQEIYWNDQNDDIILQNLFANTLLSDDFSKKALTDLDLGLGFDNLQLYNDRNLENNSDNTCNILSEITASDIITNSANEPKKSGVFFEHHDKSSDHFIISINEISTVLQNNNKHEILKTYTYDNENNTGTSNIRKGCDLSKNNADIDINSSTKNNLEILEFLNQPSLLELSLIDDKGSKDNSLFKKPSIANDFINLGTLNDEQKQLTNNTFVNTSDILEVTDKKKQNNFEYSNVKKSSNFISKIKDTSNSNSKLKKKKRRSKLINSSTNFNNHNEGLNIGCLPVSNSTNPSKKPQEYKNSKSKSNKLNTFIFPNSNMNEVNAATDFVVKNNLYNTTRKLDNKPSKLTKLKLNINKYNQIKSSIEPLNKKFAGSLDINNKNELSEALKENPSQNESAQISLQKKDFVNELNFPNLNYTNFLNSCSNDLNNDKNVVILQNMKKDEVDLHIKELSLLDLHSSEDDSNEFSSKINFNIKNDYATYHGKKKDEFSLNNGVLNKNVISNSSSLLSSTSSSTSSIAINSNLLSNNAIEYNKNIFNEIITKRIKYSQNVSQNKKMVNPNLLNSSSIESTSFRSVVENDKNEISKLVRSESENDKKTTVNLSISLDSNKNNDESINEILQGKTRFSQDHIYNNNNSLFSPLSPPNIFKKKRKKKDNSNPNNESSEKNETFLESIDPISEALLQSNINILKSNVMSTVMNSGDYKINDETINEMRNNKIYKLNEDQIDPLHHMKNLDLNNDLNQNDSSKKITVNDLNVDNLRIDLNDAKSRNILWSLLKNHSTIEELVDQFGAVLHDKITFWDLAQIKLKHTKTNHLKATYQIIDDYTVLYSNMRTYLEKFVNEQSITPTINSSSRKSENSSRSRSSSRNPRKQSSSNK